jgi:hypothetical protein
MFGDYEHRSLCRAVCRELGSRRWSKRDLREYTLGEMEVGCSRIRAHQNDPVYQRMIAEQRWDVIPGAIGGNNCTTASARAEAHRREASQRTRCAVVHGGVIAHIRRTPRRAPLRVQRRRQWFNQPHRDDR